MKAFKYRLYPTKQQAEQLDWILARCCEVYNAALQERREAWKYAHTSISFAEQSRSLTDIRNQIRPEYQQIGSHVLQNVLRRVDNAFKAFFRRVKTGAKPGYPRYQSRSRYASFCFPDASGWKLEGHRLKLTSIGTIKIRLHRDLQRTIKTTTIKREGSHWYVIFTCDVAAEKHTPYTDEAVGIDLGTMKLATLSTGDVIENPRHLRRSAHTLAKAQQALSRKKRGSNRRKKAAQRVAKLHRHVANQRKDSLHKQSRWLVDCYDTIIFEKLQPANLTRRPQPIPDEHGTYLPNRASPKAGLHQALLDAGWAMFVQFVRYKAAWADTSVLFVSPYKTSQICSACGTEVKKDLHERWHRCPCATTLDRDHNAALNILHLALAQRLQKPF